YQLDPEGPVRVLREELLGVTPIAWVQGERAAYGVAARELLTVPFDGERSITRTALVPQPQELTTLVTDQGTAVLSSTADGPLLTLPAGTRVPLPHDATLLRSVGSALVAT